MADLYETTLRLAWTKDEDTLLLLAAKSLPRKDLATLFENRTFGACISRLQKLKHGDPKPTSRWSADEQSILIESYTHGGIQAAKSALPGRSAWSIQCRLTALHLYEKVPPVPKEDLWTIEEDIAISIGYNTGGSRGAREAVPHRTPGAVSARISLLKSRGVTIKYAMHAPIEHVDVSVAVSDPKPDAPTIEDPPTEPGSVLYDLRRNQPATKYHVWRSAAQPARVPHENDADPQDLPVEREPLAESGQSSVIDRLSDPRCAEHMEYIRRRLQYLISSLAVQLDWRPVVIARAVQVIAARNFRQEIPILDRKASIENR
jgi:hypothetical protein